jgi:hypothetical protein
LITGGNGFSVSIGMLGDDEQPMIMAIKLMARAIPGRIS